MKPRYSIIRIERAKQRALTGSAFKVQPGSKGKFTIDWCGDDEEALHGLISQWNPETGHQGLNELIDSYEFSHGRHYDNCQLTKLITVHPGDTTVRYKQFTEQWGHTA